MSVLLQDWITEQAEQGPGRTAVVHRNETLTYGGLDRLSTGIARALRDAGCEPGDRVGLLMPKTPTAIAAMVGVYKAGCTLVPLDPRGPGSRLARILDACSPRCILAVGTVSELLADATTWQASGEEPGIGWLEDRPEAQVGPAPLFTLSDVWNQSPAPLEARNRPADAAHILFTSGSTGVPKGVVVTHASVRHFVNWATTYFGMAPDDRVSGHAPLVFDLSTFDIFGAFAVGAELHLVPEELNLLPHKLAEFMREARLTQWFSVPSVLHYLAQSGVVMERDFPDLRRLLWCGDVLPTPSLVSLMQRLPHVSFTNLYGPTEATIASSYYTLQEVPSDDDEAIPIGTPCPGEELLVLDEDMRPLPPGEVGDLYIAGAGLSPGYWNDPQQTALAFVPDPGLIDGSGRLYRTGDLARIGDDGLFYFLGRSDSQVKTRGYRVELGEIETALHTLDYLRECAVVAIPTDGFAGSLVCCAYAANGNGDITSHRVRRDIARLLPSYMVPARWMTVERLPVNANGKIDRPHLQKEFARRDETDAA